MEVKVLKSYPDHNAEENIPGLEALKDADLAVFFLDGEGCRRSR